MFHFEWGISCMKLPGYWVSANAGSAFLKKTTFDETELDPATNWKQTWQNQDGEGPVKGYVDLDDALISAAHLMAKSANHPLSHSDLDKVARYEPIWQNEDCKIQSLCHLLGPQTV
jgi:hypothetical protein